MESYTPIDLLSIVKKTMKAAEYCFFVTRGEGGESHVRLMQPYEPEQDLTVWFGASPRSRKVKELAISNKVSLAFINPQSQGYATLYGTAEVITNIKLKRQYWRAYWSDIFPGGPDNPDYILIKVTPYKIELMDFAQQALPQPYGLKPAVLIRDSEVWKLVPGEE